MADVDRTLWQAIIQRVVSSGGNIIRPWFTQLEPICLEHGLLEIQAPARPEQEYCQRHAARLFTEAAQMATGRLVSACSFMPAQRDDDSPQSAKAPGVGGGADASAALKLALPAAAGDGHAFGAEFSQDFLSEFSAEHSFDTFVTGPCNRLAHAACLAVSESPGKAYNPLFIHGSAGLGKTHLLQATCRRVAADKGGTKICFLSCETFVNHFIDAVGHGQLHEFRYRYRQAGVLVIDDIQFLSDHEQSQEEFFHTFNTLYQSQSQIILSSDRGPDQIPQLEERLVSRFNWGLVARIDRPCYETRVAIVKKKARLRNIDLPEDVVCFLAGRIETNTRELEGAIAKVAMLAQVNDRAIDMAMAEEALGDQRPSGNREITIDDILNAVTSRFSVRLSDLQSKKRSRSIAFPRQICMYLARNLTRHSLEEIGGYFGGRDHTTVLYANRAIEQQKAHDPQFQATLELITQTLQGGK